jgi:hypothetical protein
VGREIFTTAVDANGGGSDIFPLEKPLATLFDGRWNLTIVDGDLGMAK